MAFFGHKLLSEQYLKIPHEYLVWRFGKYDQSDAKCISRGELSCSREDIWYQYWWHPN